jgi:hypothetical protein
LIYQLIGLVYQLIGLGFISCLVCKSADWLGFYQPIGLVHQLIFLLSADWFS